MGVKKKKDFLKKKKGIQKASAVLCFQTENLAALLLHRLKGSKLFTGKKKKNI